MNEKTLYAAIITLFGVGLYLNSISYKFVYDDLVVIQKNPDVRSDTPLKLLFSNDFWATPIKSNASHKSFRPLTVLSFRINRLLAHHTVVDPQGFTPEDRMWAYHSVNIAIHVVNCLLLFKLCMSFEFRPFVAFVASLLFATHPVHTEAVSGLTGRADMLGALFTFLALQMYSRVGKNTRTSANIEFLREAVIVAISMALCFCACLCKDTAIVAVGIVVVYDYLFLTKNTLRSKKLQEIADSHVESQDYLSKIANFFPNLYRNNLSFFHKRSLPFFIWRMILTGVLSSLFLGWRKSVVGDFWLNDFRHLEAPIAHTTGFKWLINVFLVIMKYVQLTFLPSSLSFDYSFNCIPLAEKIMDFRVLIGIGFVFFGIAFIIYNALFIHNLFNRISIFFVCFYGFFLLPATNLFFFVGTMIAERLLYSPSVGFCVLLPHIAFARTFARPYSLFNRNVIRRIFWIIFGFGFIVLLFSVKTYNQNKTWESNSTLAKAAEKVCPKSAKVKYFLAFSDEASNDPFKAIDYLNKAHEIDPTYCDIYLATGLEYMKLSDITRALEYAGKGLNCTSTQKQASLFFQTVARFLIGSYPESPYVKELIAESFIPINKNQAARFIVESSMHYNKLKFKKEAKQALQRGWDMYLKNDDCVLSMWVFQIALELEMKDIAENALALSMSSKCSPDVQKRAIELVRAIQATKEVEGKLHELNIETQGIANNQNNLNEEVKEVEEVNEVDEVDEIDEVDEVKEENEADEEVKKEL